MPNSAIGPRRWLRSIVCCFSKISRTRWIPVSACCATLLTATTRIDGRLTASQIAAASAASFLFRRTYAFA
jgi:hypothetical protein